VREVFQSSCYREEFLDELWALVPRFGVTLGEDELPIALAIAGEQVAISHVMRRFARRRR
jgi:bifunctional pyridoxal-dependent enzyme with beta-cystathionase and maltose regulon repressor activities